MKWILIYEAKDGERDRIEKKVMPLLEGMDVSLQEWSKSKSKKADQDKSKASKDSETVHMLWLGEDPLRSYLVTALKSNQTVALLPHPDWQTAGKGLGVQTDLEESVEDIRNRKEAATVDILYCNDRPVFESVNVGEIFRWVSSGKKSSLARQFVRFLRNIWRVGQQSHTPYVLFSNDEKIIETSGLGIVAVEHPVTSVVSRQWVEESKGSDGLFHFFVLAPQNIFDLISFLFRSILSPVSQKTNQPSFVGYIKTSNIEVKSGKKISYTQDGEAQEAASIRLKVAEEKLRLWQTSVFSEEVEAASREKIEKLEGVPQGEARDALIRSNLPWLPRATTEQFKELFGILREQSYTTKSYIVMMILSSVIATFGLYGNSSPVIIGAMILAPLMSPIVSFSMGVVRYDVPLLKRSIRTVGWGTLVSLLFAAGISLIIPMRILTPEIVARLSPNLLDLGIAVASGIAAAFAHARVGIAKSLAGVAIAVALVPPLAVTGLGLGWLDWEIFSGAFLLYLTNLAGIILFAGLTFWLLGFAPFRRAKAGLLYTFVLVALICIPLTISFQRIKEEAQITRSLEGYKVEDMIIRDVRVRFGKPSLVTLKVVAPRSLSDSQLDELHRDLEERVGKTIRLEIVSAVELK